MISEEELLKAIEETEKLPVSFQNCEKLAVFYTLLDHKQAEEIQILRKSGESEFLSVISGKSLNDILPVLDELMQTLDVVQNKLYKSTINTLKSI